MLKIENLTGGYVNIPVLKNISFEVNDGELVGLREDAPPDVKKAFEEYVAEEKKIREEAEKEGYLIS